MKTKLEEVFKVLTAIGMMVLFLAVFTEKGNAGDLNWKAKQLMAGYLAKSKVKKVKHCNIKITDVLKRKTAKKVNPKKLFKGISKSSDRKAWNIIAKSKSRYKKRIYKAVLKYSRMYSVKPHIAAAVLYNESSMRHNAKHKACDVKINGKRIRMSAVGLGGVMYLPNKKLLNKNGIYSRNALWNIEANIKASIVILAYYKKLKRVKGAKNNTDKMLMRYYGLIKRGNKFSRIYPIRIYRIIRRMA